MADPLQLRVTSRTTKGRRQLERLRAQGHVPAVLYGHGVATVSLAAPARELLKVYRQAGESTLLDLVVDDGSSVKALIQEVQTDPITRQLLHIDFRQVNLREKISAHIKLTFSGIAPAVKEHGGVLMTNLTELAVTSLPQDLVPEIFVDLSSLRTFADYIHIRDLPLPPGVTASGRPEDVVAHVVPPRTEEELKALDQKPEVTAAPAPTSGESVPAPETAGGEGEAAGKNKA